MPDMASNGRIAYLSDLNALRDWIDERLTRERAETRQDMAALEARVRDDLASMDAKLTQVVNHQAHDLAAHDAAITKLREETIPEIRQSIVRLEAKLVRLESKLWWLVLAAGIGSAVSGNLPGALEWVVKRLGG